MVRRVHMISLTARIGLCDLALREHGHGSLVCQLETANFSVDRDVLEQLIQGVCVHKVDSSDWVEREVRWIERELDRTGNVLQGVC